MFTHSPLVLPELAENTAFLRFSWGYAVPARKLDGMQPYAPEATDGKLLVAEVLLLLSDP